MTAKKWLDSVKKQKKKNQFEGAAHTYSTYSTESTTKNNRLLAYARRSTVVKITHKEASTVHQSIYNINEQLASNLSSTSSATLFQTVLWAIFEVEH